MALRKIIEVEGDAFVLTQNGSVSLGPQKTAFSAYCKITNINGNKETGKVTVECVDKNYKISKNYMVQFSVTENALNFVKQAYEHLKTLPEWADASDC